MKKSKKLLALLLAFAMLTGLTAVAAPGTVSAKKVAVKKVSVNAPYSKTAYVAKGKSITLSAKVSVSPNKSANRKVTYTSKNKKVATVSSKGVVKAKKVGTTKVVVTSKKNKKKKATVTVKVVPKPVTKVKLSKTKASMNIGERLALKTKVSAKKGASKRIYWKSSRTAVATVSQKGVVVAKKTGSVNITAMAIDGSKKKATCKITVRNVVNMTSMNVLNRQSVSFSLDRPFALSAANISVMTKEVQNGAYRRQMIIDNISTTDNRNYTVVLNNETRISKNQYVSVSVPGLPGSVKSLEMQYREALCAFTDEQISEWTVNKYRKTSFSFYQDGYASYSITGLPAGLTAESKGGELYVKGTPTAAGTYPATMTAIDELGNTMTKVIYFIVGAPTALAGAALPEYTLISTNTSYNAYSYIEVVGGSGDYTYSIIADAQGTGAKLGADWSSDNTLSAKIAAPGDYTVVVRATDRQNPALFVDVNVIIHAAQGITVAGVVKDAAGNPMKNAKVSFDNKNEADRYMTYRGVSTDENGAYSATLSPGNYDIEASYHNNDDDYSSYSENAQAITYLYNQSMTATCSGFDLMLPLYKVTLVSTAFSVDNTVWYWNHEELGSGNTLYLKPGTYTIESNTTSSTESATGDWFNGTQTVSERYRLSASFTLANAAAQAGVTKTVLESKVSADKSGAKDTAYVVELNQYDWLDSDIYAYAFTPEETGEYSITADDVYFYDMNGTKLTMNLSGRYELTAGTKYIVGDGTFKPWGSFMISKEEVTE